MENSSSGTKDSKPSTSMFLISSSQAWTQHCIGQSLDSCEKCTNFQLERDSGGVGLPDLGTLPEFWVFLLAVFILMEVIICLNTKFFFYCSAQILYLFLMILQSGLFRGPENQACSTKHITNRGLP